MKRSLEDSYMTSSLKRPLMSSPAEPSGQTMGGMQGQKLTTKDALSYLKAVKEMFPDRRDKYDEFLDVMKDFKALRIDTSGVIARVKELFKGHRDLILGFNAFLPEGYEINLPIESEAHAGAKKPVDFDEAINFVNKIKTRFQGDDHVYKTFLDILNLYRKENKSIQEVYREVAALFCDHRDLLIEFTHFLPDYSAEASLRNAHPARNSTLRRDVRGSPKSMARIRDLEKKASVSHADRDTTEDWPDQHNEKLEFRTDKYRRKYVKEESSRMQERDGRRINNDLVQSQKKKCANDKDLVADVLCEGMHGKGIALCEKVKERLANPDDYQEFMKCLHIYKNNQINDSQLRSLVFDVLKDYPDLWEEFDNLKTRLASLWTKRDISTLAKVDDKCRDIQFEMEARDKDCDVREKDRYDQGLSLASRDAVGQRMSSNSCKYWTKPIQELDLSVCESCTPSYRLLPKNYPIPLASQRTKMGSEVLNDHWVSVTSGSEDYSFKHMRRNQYEESLFRCEDDRFELDMLLEAVNATSRRVEELLQKTNNDSSTICFEDHFTDLDLRCIERLYGEHGLDVMDVLRRNASLALPVILTRLKQKQEEWARCRADFNKVWAEIYAKNHHKSLDHRSFYFKQQDMKSLSTKVLLAEIKEVSDNKRKEDGVLVCLAAGRRPPFMHHLEFEYPDPDIHQDLYKLIKYYCGVMCTPEQSNKVLKMWTTFLEPMLGVPCRPKGTENSEEVTKSKCNNSKSTNISTRESSSPAGRGSVSGCQPSTSCKIGDDSIPHERSSINDANAVKDGDSYYAGVLRPNIDSSCDIPPHGTLLNDSSVADAISAGGKIATYIEQVSNSVCVPKEKLIVRGEDMSESSTRIGPSNPNADDGFQMKTSNDSQDADRTRLHLTSPAHALESVITGRCQEASVEEGKFEKEDGELSPNGDFEEDNFAACGDTGKESAGKSKDIADSKLHQEATGLGETCFVDAGDNDPNTHDECEESSHKLSEDSENASQNDDVSGSESANREDCPAEKDDDDGDHDDFGDKAESEGEAEGMEEAQFDIGDGTFLAEHVLQAAKPITRWIPQSADMEHGSQIFYGNDSFYVLFRLHHILYERIQKAKFYSSAAETKWRNTNDDKSTDLYARFMNALCNLLDGSSDNTKFEDDCRSIMGTQAYLLFTLEKLIYKLVKQLQSIVTDEMNEKLLQLHAYERSRKQEMFDDYCYGENARVILHDENIYRIEYVDASKKLSMQLMDYWCDKAEPSAVSVDPDFADYVTDLLAVVPENWDRRGIFLRRNKRKYAHLDEDAAFMKASEGLFRYNGLEIKINCITSKALYVLGTEDVLFRRQKRRFLHQNGSSNGHSNGFSIKQSMLS